MRPGGGGKEHENPGPPGSDRGVVEDMMTQEDEKQPVICRDCGDAFPCTSEYFYFRSPGKPASYCKTCTKARASQHYYVNHEHSLQVRAVYREEHRGEWTDYFREYALSHAEHRSIVNKAWRERDLEGYRQAHNARYHANPEPTIARARQWEKQNPEKARAHTRQKNHRRRGAAPDAAAMKYIAILMRDPCSYCGERSSRMEIDHIVSLSAGGGGSWNNLTSACRKCNGAKSGRSLLNFLHLRSRAS